MPLISKDDKDKVTELIKTIEKFKKNCILSTKPINCGCGRRTSCFFFFKSIFGESK